MLYVPDTSREQYNTCKRGAVTNVNLNNNRPRSAKDVCSAALVRISVAVSTISTFRW